MKVTAKAPLGGHFHFFNVRIKQPYWIFNSILSKYGRWRSPRS